MAFTDPVPVEVDPVPYDPFSSGEPTQPVDIATAPSWVPTVDQLATYTGSGVNPAWDDVYQYARDNYDEKFAAGRNQTGDATAAFILDSGRAAIGSTIRALSGLITQAVDYTQTSVADLYSTLQFVLGGLDDTNRDQYTKIRHLQEEVAGLSTIAAYEEQQIGGLRETIFDAARFETAYLQDWVTRTVTEPLLRAIVEQRQYTDASILKASRNVLDQAHVDAVAQAAPAIAAVGALAPVVSQLAQESEDCVKPMCSTMGPNTDLGKLLKGLSLAASLAAIADLLSLTEPELAQRLTDVIGKFAGYVGDFEGYFTDGTETLGSVLAGIAGTAL